MGRSARNLSGSRGWLIGALCCLVCSAGLWLSGVELTQPRASDRQVTRVVVELMRRDHLLQQPLDDTIAKRGLHEFLKSLDPLKFYFQQSDIAEFEQHAVELDDQLKRGDIDYAYVIHQRFLQRVDERVALAGRLLEQPFNFADDERMVVDPDSVTYAATQAEAQDRWRKRLEYQLLTLKAEKVEGAEAVQKLQRRYASFARRMRQTDADELLELYLTAFTSSYDPHTSYMSAATLDDFSIQMRLNLEGIGAGLKIDEDGYTIVTKILPGGAAEKQGQLQEEDKIVSVGQSSGEMVDVVDMKLRDVVKLIRGTAGTQVRLGVVPAAGGEMQTYTITRATVDLSDSEAKGAVFEQPSGVEGRPFRLGVIDLPSFYMDMKAARTGSDPNFKSTTRDVRKILADFATKQVDAVVLDLRRNGGGSLSEAIDLTGLFIEQGPVVQVKDGDGRVQPYYDEDAGMAWRGPLVVVTSRFSASASEILAGAIQDYHRGLIVGDHQTHGKGTVQSLLELGELLFRVQNPPNLGALKVTMQQFYRPNGASTQQRGVEADVELPSLTDHLEGINESDLDYAIAWDQVPQARFANYRMTSPELSARLGAASATRIQGNEEFAKVRRNIERYTAQKAEKSVPLNETAFFARRAELDTDAEEEKQFENQERSSEQVVERDYYLDEVLAITADYIRALGAGKVASAK